MHITEDEVEEDPDEEEEDETEDEAEEGGDTLTVLLQSQYSGCRLGDTAEGVVGLRCGYSAASASCGSSSERFRYKLRFNNNRPGESAFSERGDSTLTGLGNSSRWLYFELMHWRVLLLHNWLKYKQSIS